MFTGRVEELKLLNEKYRTKNSEFIVVYGRRRIGKTALIREFIKGKASIFYSAVQITDKLQLDRMSEIVNKYFGNEGYNTYFSNWEGVFKYIADNSNSNEKLIVVMDEFPYMAQGNESITSVLQSVWDNYLRERNVMIIISGSSMSFMENKILSGKNPLYGRATGILKVMEMNFNEAKEFVGKATLHDYVNYYSVFSGVPYYLSLIDKNMTFEENVKNNIFKSTSVLFNEAEFLLKQELREVNQYNAIIETIALGNTRLNDIYQKTGIEKTKLPYYINSLIDLGIVEKEYPSTIKTKEMASKKNGIYKIANSFFKFYYTFVYPYISEINGGLSDIIMEDVVSEGLSMFVSYEFEKISLMYLKEIIRNGEMKIRPVRIGRWWNKSEEIDIVGYDLKDNYIFGECKWRNEKLNCSILKKLQLKSENVSNNCNEKNYILFSKSGFTKELIDLAKESKNVVLVDYSGEKEKII